MCNQLIDFLNVDNLRYCLNVSMFSAIVLIISEIIRRITNKEIIKFHREEIGGYKINKHFGLKLLWWVGGSTLTAAILVYSGLATTTFQSAVVVSIGWIKLFTELYEKHGKDTSDLPSNL